MAPLVSILIPCYNAENWLAEAVESALTQTCNNKEIIIVDDGSTDGSLDIAKQFESTSVKIISQLNQGASAARNRAYAECQGDFIQYLDADDLLAPDKIERQIQLLQQDQLGYVASGEWARFYQSPAEAQFIPQPLWTDLEPIDWLTTAWQAHQMMHPAAWLIPRSIAEQAGGWNESLSLNDDGEYFCRVVLASRGIKFCWGAKTYYRSGNTSSLSGSKSYAAWKSAFSSLELGTSHLLAKENSTKTRQICATVFQRFIYEVYPEAPDLVEAAKVKVKEFGGSNLQPSGGPAFKAITALIGWQKAKQLKQKTYGFGYAKLALGWRIHRVIDTAINTMNK
jgi:glycosyltransferase involved in cell wall biosynthesis